MAKYKIKFKYIDNNHIYGDDIELYNVHLRDFNIDLINTLPDIDDYFLLGKIEYKNITKSCRVSINNSIYIVHEIVISFTNDGDPYSLLTLKKKNYDDLPF